MAAVRVNRCWLLQWLVEAFVSLAAHTAFKGKYAGVVTSSCNVCCGCDGCGCEQPVVRVKANVVALTVIAAALDLAVVLRCLPG